MQAWSTVRAQGMRIPSGGTLVVGREQDCMGGCFDSAQGAAGDVQQRYQLEYGAQDFTGVIDELRIWKTVRSQEKIQQVCQQLMHAWPHTFTACVARACMLSCLQQANVSQILRCSIVKP